MKTQSVRHARTSSTTRWMMPALIAGVLTAGTVSVPAHVTPQDAAPRAETRTSPVNLNSATVEQLEALPGVGKSTATRIVEYRDKNGPFKKVEDLMNVKGIGEKSFLKLKPLITIGAARADRPTA